MKTVLKLSLLVSTLFFICSCQKNLSIQNENEKFNAAFVKEWYYGTFKKSKEWLSSIEHGKKLPDWFNSTYRKIGTIEIVDFRLGQQTRKVSIPNDTSISVADKKRIAESSFTRILFIKTGDKIEVRELQFVPELDYLKQKKFDLSDVNLGDGKNDFTGRIITRKWNGEILSIKGLVKGKIKTVVKLIEKKNAYKKNSETLRTIEFCDEKDECIWVITCTKMKTVTEDFTYGNSESNTFCVEAEVTQECTTSLECTLVEVEDDPNDPNDLVPSCEYNANQSCECQLLSIGCVNYQGSGNNDPGGNPFIINYQLTPTDIQIINELNAEDAESDNILLNMECKGTKRTGNINFNGTYEHWLIQLDYVQKDIFWRDREYQIPQSSSTNVNNKGYADLVNLLSNEIFEIKPSYNPISVSNGVTEVANYVTKANIFCPVAIGSVGGVWHQGTNYSKTYFPYKIPNQTLVAELVAPGVIGYKVENSSNFNPQPYPIVLPQDILAQLKELTERIRNYLSTADQTLAEYLSQHPGLVTYLKSQLVVAAVAIVVGTLVEDILTGGVGVLDDFASFTLAYRIVRFAWKIP
jgi:hypothetical protein